MFLIVFKNTRGPNSTFKPEDPPCRGDKTPLIRVVLQLGGLDEVLPLVTLKTYRVTNHLTKPRSPTRPAARVSNAGGRLASQEELCSIE